MFNYQYQSFTASQLREREWYMNKGHMGEVVVEVLRNWHPLQKPRTKVLSRVRRLVNSSEPYHYGEQSVLNLFQHPRRHYRRTLRTQRDCETVEGDDSTEDIQHMNINSIETCSGERPSHFHVSINTSLTKNCNLGSAEKRARRFV